MTAHRPPSPVAAMWAWDNPVDPVHDPRGRGYAPATADRLAAFAQAGGLREVYLLVPSGAPDGPVAGWVREVVTALHDAGLGVSAVAGPRTATPRWAESVTALAPFDRLQVAVVPWDSPGAGRTADEVGAPVVESLTAVTAAVPGVPVDASVPWWFATAPTSDGRSLLDPVAQRAARVALAAPAARAHGDDGVLDLAAPGVQALVAAGRPFTIGVQTDAPERSGGAHRTFYDEGAVALFRECGAVAAALADVPGFDGVAVAAHRAWRRLLGV